MLTSARQFASLAGGISETTGLRDCGTPRENASGLRNAMLGRLPAHEFRAMTRLFQRIRLNRRQVLEARHMPLTRVYFIEQGAVSLVERRDGHSLELAFLGHKDVVGLPLILGADRATETCIVRSPGEALCISAGELRQAMITMPNLRTQLLRYVHARMAQTAQLAFCNSLHTVEQRLSRWLLLAADSLSAWEFQITHQELSAALGIRRAGATKALGLLEATGQVELRRGLIRIVDAEALETKACGCIRKLRVDVRTLMS